MQKTNKNMGLHKVSQDAADGVIMAVGWLGGIGLGNLLGYLNDVLSVILTIVTIVWAIYRTEKLIHEKKQRNEED